MKRLILCLLMALVLAASLTANAQDSPVSEVSITATIRTYVLDAPRPNAELVNVIPAGAEQSAFGRDADALWLRTINGWVLAEVFNTVGEIGALPDATHSVNVTVTSAAQLYDGPSAKWFTVTGDLPADTKSVAIGRNEQGSWLRLPQGWIEVTHVQAEGDIRPLPVAPSGVIITAKARTFILAEPDLSAEFVDVFESGEEALAIGRAGDWLQISRGWVPEEAVDATNTVDSLAFTGAGIRIWLSDFDSIPVRPAPGSGETVRFAQKGQTESAIGRKIYKDNMWLLLSGGGWVFAKYWGADYDIMQLPSLDIPLTDGNASLNTGSTVRATATPSPVSRSESDWTVSTIRSLVSRHTKDIRILDIEIASNSTTIEYDLKPWPFVPNESIANEVAFKIICVLRKGQQISNTLKFIGQGRFKSDIGRKFKSPSVEIHISARNANRLICSGNDHSDIDWRSVSSLYKSYPIPRGASVDYD